MKDVCARCNNTWLADLEARAQTLLADRIRGYPARFTAEDKIAVAAWAAKTAMLTVRVSREHEDTVPLEHYRRFGDSRLPLPEHMVWLAAYEPQARENTCHVHATGDGHRWTRVLLHNAGGMRRAARVRPRHVRAAASQPTRWRAVHLEAVAAETRGRVVATTDGVRFRHPVRGAEAQDHGPSRMSRQAADLHVHPAGSRDAHRRAR